MNNPATYRENMAFENNEQDQKVDKDEDEENRIVVPHCEEDSKTSCFSLKKLLIFVGPGFLMSIAYLDPGNIESDLRSGSVAGYKLLWVLFLAHFLGLLLQRLSIRLGVVSGKNMAEVAYFFYPPIPRVILWLMIELAIIGSDMQEVIGTAIALYLLSGASIPIWVGVIITIVDTLTLLFMDRFGYHKFEAIFYVLIAVMAISFGFEFTVVKPKAVEILKGFIPYCKNWDKEVLLQAVGCIGAVIMPHNLYLHSALVQSRKIDRTRKVDIEEANKYFFIESALALICSFMINLFVVSVFGTGLNQVTNAEMRQKCIVSNNTHYDVFPNDNKTLEPDIYTGGVYLGCEFGAVAMYIWAIGILAAGQSSTMTGCYAGQFVMEGFLHLKWSRWKRKVFTRCIAIVPTLSVAIFSNLRQLTVMNDLLNAFMMVQLPFALIPLLTFASNERIMDSFRVSIPFRTVFSILACLLISINIYFLGSYIGENIPATWLIYSILTICIIAYFTFVFYLVYYCTVSIGANKMPIFQCTRQLFPESEYLGVDIPWLNKKSINQEAHLQYRTDEARIAANQLSGTR